MRHCQQGQAHPAMADQATPPAGWQRQHFRAGGGNEAGPCPAVVIQRLAEIGASSPSGKTGEGIKITRVQPVASGQGLKITARREHQHSGPDPQDRREIITDGGDHLGRACRRHQQAGHLMDTGHALIIGEVDILKPVAGGMKLPDDIAGTLDQNLPQLNNLVVRGPLIETMADQKIRVISKKTQHRLG